MLLCASISLLCGCGTSSSPTNTGPGGTYLSLNGNWEIIGYMAGSGGSTLTSPIANFEGALQSSGATVTGTFHTQDISNFTSPCVTLNQDLPVTGTLDTSGNLTLSVVIAGGKATIHQTLSSNLQVNPGFGSFVINGGKCAMAQVSSLVGQIAPANGTYVGTFSAYGSSASSIVTVTLTQLATPDADGLFPLSGTVVAAGSACNGSFSFTGGAITGNSINLLTETAYQSPNGKFEGAMAPDASAINATEVTFYYPNGCSLAGGILTRQ